MVDRICVGRDVKSKDHVVDTAAEEFEGNIIVLTPLDDDELVPFGGDTTVPKEKATAQFFYKRKFSIVNGGHSVLAFMTLRENDADPEEDEDKQSYMLIKPTKADKEIKKEIDAWTGMRIVQLIDEFGIDTIAKAVGVDAKDEEAVFKSMQDWGNHSLQRFSSLDDYTDRIFGGERPNRWVNRVRPIWIFTQENEFAGTDTPQGRFIKWAKLDESYAREKIASLAEYGAKMTSKCIQDKYNETSECLENNKK
jgi:hypothetical protein